MMPVRRSARTRADGSGTSWPGCASRRFSRPWPMASFLLSEDDMTTNVLQSVVSFLRVGYPNGVPEHDYQPLLALLRRRLSLEEVEQVAAELPATGAPATAEAICAAVANVMQAEAGEQDIARVRAHLAAAGWPQADSV